MSEIKANERDFMKKLTLFLVPLMCLFITGCGTYAKFTYPSDYNQLTQLYEKPKYQLTVGVLPLEDKRLNMNNAGGYFLYLIPLMPYGQAQYTRPDSANMFVTVTKYEFTPSEDLAKAIVTSLRRSNLFKNVFFTYGGDTSPDLLIKGSILSTDYQGKIYSYGLSIIGPDLWLFGLPAGSSYNQLKLDLTLNKPDTSELIWEYSFNKENTVVQGYYYNWGHDVKAYSDLMQDGMNEAIKDLAAKLQTVYSKDSGKVNLQSNPILPTEAKKETVVEKPKIEPKQNFGP